MSEQSTSAWEALFAPAGYGSLLPGPVVHQSAVPDFVDNAAELVIPTDTPEVVVDCVDAGDANTLTITLPTSLKNLGKKMVLILNQTTSEGTICTVAVANVLTGYGSDDAANGVYVLEGIQVDSAVVWAPIALTAIPDVE